MGQVNAAPVVVGSVMAGAALLAVLAVVGHRRRRSTT
jgi:MYXO-CTERM domain-containing protein